MTSEPLAELGRDSLVGAYRVVKEIGWGGMSTVYEAGHIVLPRRAALKVMHANLRRQPGIATRFVQEAAILDGVRHPGVVRVYDCNLLPDRRPWIAMELVEGETLANRLHQATVLPPAEVAALLGDVAEVLAAVHAAGVLHRDLKPDNLFCTPTNCDYPIRVLDWGVARVGPIGRLTIDGLTPGTPIYMAPEQATGRDTAAPCDVYSLGIIAYEALTGRPPFDEGTLAEIVCMHLNREPAPLRTRCHAPADLCDLVARMLHKSPSSRPTALEVCASARAIARDLAQAYEEFELSGIDTGRAGARGRIPAACIVPTGEIAVQDAGVVEHGVIEMLPVVPKSRWTPEIGDAPAVLADQDLQGTSAPRAPGDLVAGASILDDKAR